MGIALRKTDSRSTYSGTSRFWFFFVIFLLLDGLFLYFFAAIRFDTNDPSGILRFLPLDIYTTGWIVAGVILQFLIIFLGFLLKFWHEPKIEIYPNYTATDRLVYHNFDVEQLLSLIDVVAKSFNDQPIKYNKVYVLKNSMSQMFSFSLLKRKFIVLDPAILQIAQTQELRSYLVQDMLLVSSKLALIRMVYSQAQYLWFVILAPIAFRFIRELFSYLVYPDNVNSEYVFATGLVFMLLIITGVILRPLHLRILRLSSNKIVMLIDILAAERWRLENLSEYEIKDLGEIKSEIENNLKQSVQLIEQKEIFKAIELFDKSISLIVTFKILTQKIESLLIKFNLELIQKKYLNEAKECFYSKILVLKRIFTYQKYYFSKSRVFRSIKFQLLEGLLLKNSYKLRELGKGQEILEELVEKSKLNPEDFILAIFNLCELSLFEMNLETDNEKSFRNINNYILLLNNYGEKHDHPQSQLLAKIIEIKVLLIQTQFEKIENTFSEITQLIEINNLANYEELLEQEKRNYYRAIKRWKELSNLSAGSYDEISFNELKDYIKNAQEMMYP